MHSCVRRTCIGFTVTVTQRFESPHDYILNWREILLTRRIFFREMRQFFKKKNKEINIISVFYGCKTAEMFDL